MNSSFDEKRCPKCGGNIAADAPQGLCPRCVLAGAATPTEPGVRPGARWAVPSRETVAAAFPDLEIGELLGVGGMGVVYRARQPKLDRWVALKLLPPALSADPAFAERFQREARFLARLQHPNIVSVFDFGQAGAFCYLLLEFVDGVNLRQAMQAGRFSPAEALALIPNVCAALQYAHDQGVLHRDIKPENILLDARGQVKLADFGIAKLVGEPGDGPGDITLTQSGARLGTPHYMAPEQFEKPSEVDHRADVYSLGVVFYELLTGELPLGRFGPPSEKAALDARIDAIVFRALARERELRQQSAGQVRTEIEGVVSTPAGPATALRSPGPSTSAELNSNLPAWARWFAWGLTAYIVFTVVRDLTWLPNRPPAPGLGALVPFKFQMWSWSMLLIPAAVALANRREVWRYCGLIGAAVLLANPLAAAAGVLIPAGLGRGSLPSMQPGLEALVVGVVAMATLGVLSWRSVVIAFKTPRCGRVEIAPDPWLHRLIWLLLGGVVLPLAALIAGLVAPQLLRVGFSLGAAGLWAGLIPATAGASLVLGFRMTRPSASRAIPVAEWSRLTHLLFWLVCAGVTVPACLLLPALLVPFLTRAGWGAIGGLTLLLPVVVLGWLVMGFIKTRPGRSSQISDGGGVESARSVVFRMGLGITLPVAVLILGFAALPARFLGRSIPFAPIGAPLLNAELPDPSAQIAVTRTHLSAQETTLALQWELRSPQPAQARVAFRKDSRTATLARDGDGQYRATVFVHYAITPDGNSVTMTVQVGDAAFTTLLPGDGSARELLRKSGQLVGTDLMCTFNNTVWIAFGGNEQVTLTLLSAAGPNGPVGGLPAELPVPPAVTSAAALQWHNAWLQLKETEGKAAVGVVAPEGPEMLAARRDLAVAEAAFRVRPIDAAQAESDYAQALLAIKNAQASVGRATSAEVRDAALAALKAGEALGKFYPAVRTNLPLIPR